MNNLEITQLKRDMKEYLSYSDEELDNLGVLTDIQLHSIKRDIVKAKAKRENTTSNRYTRNLIKKKINSIFESNPELKKKRIITGRGIGRPNKKHGVIKPQESKIEKVKINVSQKPKILFISDVKGWAWWIKSEYLKKYLLKIQDSQPSHIDYQ